MSNCQKTLENLFISKVRVKALRYFMLNPEKSIHLRGAVREFSEEVNAVRRELARLEEVKIVNAEAKGNRKYFSLNSEHPFIAELISIFHKSFGVGGEILKNVKRLGQIDYAFLTPAFTKGNYYGTQIIDLIIIGEVDMQILAEIVKKEEQSIGKEIHYMILKPSDFNIRKRRRDQLIIDLMVQDNVMLIGNKEELIK
jgi:hypothetical protein